MNLPNRLTLGRLVLTALFVIALSGDFLFHGTAALLFFILATITDYLDGVIARRMNLTTDFGKLMDPLVDKILVASAFILLVTYDALPAWAVIVIISREFLITGLRVLASSKGIILPAEKLGKHKTAWQMITIIFFLLLLSVAEFTGADTPVFAFLWNYLGAALVWVTVILTVYSGLGYLFKNRELIHES